MREKERERGVFPYDVRYTERSRGPRSACFAYTSRSAGVLHFFSLYVRTSSLALSFSLSFSLSLHLTESRSPSSSPNASDSLGANTVVGIIVSASGRRRRSTTSTTIVESLLSDPHAGPFVPFEEVKRAPGPARY